MQQAGMGTGAREEDIYGRIRAMQTPEEQRQSMALEERLAAQGRLGVRTNQYGGTPEQLALEKAREEAQNQASLMAMQQAQQEQLQQANLGTNFATLGNQMAQGSQGLLGGQLGLSQTAQQGAYIPQAALLDALQPGLAAATMGQKGASGSLGCPSAGACSSYHGSKRSAYRRSDVRRVCSIWLGRTPWFNLGSSKPSRLSRLRASFRRYRRRFLGRYGWRVCRFLRWTIWKRINRQPDRV